MKKNRSRKDCDNFFFGIILLAVGIVFVLNSMGLPVLQHLWRFWPCALIWMGVCKLKRVRLHKDREAGS
ncbi:LiaI-LiaF-like domain-containing protein [Acidobacteriota bacterium]